MSGLIKARADLVREAHIQNLVPPEAALCPSPLLLFWILGFSFMCATDFIHVPVVLGHKSTLVNHLMYKAVHSPSHFPRVIKNATE